MKRRTVLACGLLGCGLALLLAGAFGPWRLLIGWLCLLAAVLLAEVPQARGNP